MEQHQKSTFPSIVLWGCIIVKCNIMLVQHAVSNESIENELGNIGHLVAMDMSGSSQTRAAPACYEF